MLRNSAILLLIAAALNKASAEDYTLVEKDTYGTGFYYQGAIIGEQAYVNSGMRKVERFEVSTPTSLVKQSDLPLTCIYPITKIVTDGNIVAAQCLYTIEFFDVTDVNNITNIGKYDSESYVINGIVLEGDRLYMLGGNSDLLTFDSSDLAKLVELGRTNVGTVQTEKVTKVGNYLYAVNSVNSLDIYDVSVASNPQKTASHPAVGTVFYNVEILGDYAYLGTGRGIQVVDIKDKAAPVMVTNVSQDTESNSLNSLTSIENDNNNFVAVDSQNNIRLVDLSNPAIPTVSPPKLTLDYWVRDVELNGDTLVVFNGVDGIRTVDISDSDSFVYQDQFNNSIEPHKISLDGNTALVAGAAGAYHLIDLDADLNISERGDLPSYFNFWDGVLNGNIARVSRNNVISTLDITDIDNPVEIDSDSFGVDWTGFTNFEQSDNQLIAGSITAGIGVYDISNIGLTEVLTVDLGTDPISNSYRGVIDIAKKGDNLFVTTEQTDVSIIDISDLANPTISGHFDWSSYDNSDRHLEIFGNRLFIARDIGLLVVDITDPSSPQFIETNSDFGLPDTIQAIDSQYAVISNRTTLYLVDFEDETNPTIVDEITTNTRFGDLGADLTKILAAEKYGSSLKSYQVNQGPISSNSSNSVDEDLALNDSVVVSDREDDAITMTVTQDVANGSLTFNSDGTYSYQPAINFFGVDSFVYQATDIYGGMTSSQVDITVNPVNDAPSASDSAATVVEGTSLSGNLVGNDVDGDQLTFSVESTTSNGNLTVTSQGAYTYTPNNSFVGADNFTFKVTDVEGESATASVAISVSAEQSSGSGSGSASSGSSGSSGGGGSVLWLLAIGFLTRFRQFEKAK